MNIINPQFSFVQFAPGSAPADCDYLLPVALNSDIKFQSTIGTSGASESNAVVAATQKLFVVKSGAVVTDESSLSANTLFAQTDFFSATELNDTNVLICWSAAINGIEDMDSNTCFRLCMRIDNGSAVLYLLSNCFQKISDTKYNNTLEYYGTSDNYGFSYCDGCSNKVRLPFYLGGPQAKEEQTAYIYSDGRRKLTKYQAGKLFEVKVGVVPEDIHDKITTALAHDVVNITSPRYTGGIRKDGDYTIAWDRPEDLTAPASTKAYATPYNVVNDNCAECDEFCGTISSLSGTTIAEPPACATITSLNGTTVAEVPACATIVSLNGTTETEVACSTWFNNTGNTLSGINYTDCGGTAFSNQDIADGQSVCAQDGTVGGGDWAFLTDLGAC